MRTEVVRHFLNRYISIFLSIFLVSPSILAAGSQHSAQQFRSLHHRALARGLNAPIKGRWDRDRKVRVPLSDRSHWRRVRFRLLDHFSGFKNEDALLYSSVFTFETKQKNPTSAQCIRAFEQQNQKRLKQFKVQHDGFKTIKKSWRGKPLYLRTTEAFIRVFFTKHRFSAAWGAYPAYENGCLVYAFISRWKNEGQLAQAARERWVEQSTQVKSRGKLVPHRSRRK